MSHNIKKKEKNDKIKKEYLKDIIYKKLKNDIFSGHIEQGSCVLESEIAAKYSVSRTPVREALLMLSHEGILDSLPKNGYIVKSISYKDILDNLYVRMFLEIGAINLTATRITDEKIKELEELVNYEFKNKKEVWENNEKFHLIIAELSGNKKLRDLIRISLNEDKKIIMIDPVLSIVTEHSEEHREIVKALKLRDPEKAQEAMKRHLSESRSRIYEQLI